MKIERIRIDPDPYEPFRLAQGYRVGETGTRIPDAGDYFSNCPLDQW